MNTVFIDSSFWISYRTEDSPRQFEASEIVAKMNREGVRLVITLPVLCEIHATFSRKRVVRELIIQDFWNNPLIKVEEISMQDHANAIQILRTNGDKTYSLCDALSFAVMRRLRIGRVASFDRHFKQFGEFEILT